MTARADGSGGTNVEVTYDLTALSADGNENLADLDEVYYAKMMREWERLITEAEIEYPVQFAD